MERNTNTPATKNRKRGRRADQAADSRRSQPQPPAGSVRHSGSTGRQTYGVLQGVTRETELPGGKTSSGGDPVYGGRSCTFA